MPVLPYVDNATFIEAPTGIDTSQIVPQGVSAQESAALTNVLERASDWVDQICFQDLRATLENPEEQEIRPDRYGRLRVFTQNFPIIALASVSWMDTRAGTFTAVDLTKTQVAPRSFLVYDKNYLMWRGLGMVPLVMQYTYSAGYAHTTLSASAAAGSTQLQVPSILGIGSGYGQTNKLSILDGANREDVTITLIGSGVSGNPPFTLTTAATLAHDHASGALITAMPPTIQQATITLAAFLIRSRGTGALVMGPRGGGRSTQSGVGSQGAQRIAQQTGLDEAIRMLKPFTRVL